MILSTSLAQTNIGGVEFGVITKVINITFSTEERPAPNPEALPYAFISMIGVLLTFIGITRPYRFKKKFRRQVTD